MRSARQLRGRGHLTVLQSKMGQCCRRKEAQQSAAGVMQPAQVFLMRSGKGATLRCAPCIVHTPLLKLCVCRVHRFLTGKWHSAVLFMWQSAMSLER